MAMTRIRTALAAVGFALLLACVVGAICESRCSARRGVQSSDWHPDWDWEGDVESDGCTRQTLVRRRLAWDAEMARHPGGFIGSRLEMVELGQTPPPLVCRKECPIEIVPFGRIGPVRLGDPLARQAPFPDYQPYAAQTRVSGVYALDSDDGATVSEITVNVFDFPDRCLRINGALLDREGSFEEWSAGLGDCKFGYDLWIGSHGGCAEGKISFSVSSMEGPAISIRL